MNIYLTWKEEKLHAATPVTNLLIDFWNTTNDIKWQYSMQSDLISLDETVSKDKIHYINFHTWFLEYTANLSIKYKSYFNLIWITISLIALYTLQNS